MPQCIYFTVFNLDAITEHIIPIKTVKAIRGRNPNLSLASPAKKFAEEKGNKIIEFNVIYSIPFFSPTTSSK